MKRILKVILDVDDTLIQCMPYALERVNQREKRCGKNVLTPDMVTGWGRLGKATDKMFEEFDKMDFYATQPIIEGASEFVRKLCQVAEVYIFTAVKPSFATARVIRLKELFPDFPEENIIIGSRKDLLSDADVILDDGAHNVCASKTAYPVLLRKPWNWHMTGTLAVNNYHEFLSLITELMQGPRRVHGNKIISLVGPSGSGKTDIVRALPQECFETVKSYTTDQEWAAKDQERYRYLTSEEFQKCVSQGLFFEHSVYAQNCFGTMKADVLDILNKGKHAVIPMDIAGAFAYKMHFCNSLSIYVHRPMEVMLDDILARPIPNRAKRNRIISINTEKRNRDICDYIIQYDELEDAVKQLLAIANT